MPTPKILFPICSLPVPTVNGAEVVSFDPTTPIQPEDANAEVLVTWEMSAGQVRDAIAQLPHLRLVQLLSAGMDQVPAMRIPDGVRVEGGSGLHNETVAEHALALILAGIRGVNDLVRAQIGHRWATEWAGTGQLADPTKLITLHDANVLILGYGNIGRELGKYLRALGANVTGVGRTARIEDSVSVVTFDDLPQVLPQTDVLVSVLPDSPETTDIVDCQVLATLPDHAWFVNVGRGATVNENDLIAALRDGEIAGAAIDVAKEEPLLPSSPLWDLPNLIISPHSAGGRPRGYAELIERNLAELRD